MVLLKVLNTISAPSWLKALLRFFNVFCFLEAHKKKIGFKGQLLIEPKPKEPTRHQYDYGKFCGMPYQHLLHPPSCHQCPCDRYKWTASQTAKPNLGNINVECSFTQKTLASVCMTWKHICLNFLWFSFIFCNPWSFHLQETSLKKLNFSTWQNDGIFFFQKVLTSTYKYFLMILQ